ncbi:hypothetical protein PTKIN_Ptkin19aG0022200 [Pterospermum kingtungense]
MLKFNNRTILILAIFLATCGLAIVSQAVAYNIDVNVDDISPSAVLTGDNVSRSLQPLEAEQPENLYLRCVVILGHDCADEFFDLIFRNDTPILTDKDIEVVSEKCCEQLVNMGRHCHDKLFNVIAQTTDFSSNLSATLPRSSQVWDLCSLSSS